jgi:transglutaminase-like putative cysteine protease
MATDTITASTIPAVPNATRRVHVKHTTEYVYDRDIERSAHRLHLRPIHDRLQHEISHRLRIETDAGVESTDDCVEYEDVFGNGTIVAEITRPYRRMSITAESVVELLDVDPFFFPAVRSRPKFPVTWMPSERMMLAPYLTPVELPETQLEEISAYARQFVERNQNDLLETLFEVNLTLFREYAYVPQSTTIETTPFDVFTNKRGVCQDFANLMICMMRMLDIPARYVCGYVHTGNHGPTRAQSDSTHAWVQLYLPHAGWKAFDPTNGVLPTVDHVRLAVGRHFRETAPIAGTLYTPAVEQMRVDVEVTTLDPETGKVTDASKQSATTAAVAPTAAAGSALGGGA